MKHYYFTFGSDHLDGKGLHKYVEIICSDYEEARRLMWAMFEAKWAFQYEEEEFAHVRSLYTRHMLITVEVM